MREDTVNKLNIFLLAQVRCHNVTFQKHPFHVVAQLEVFWQSVCVCAFGCMCACHGVWTVRAVSLSPWWFMSVLSCKLHSAGYCSLTLTGLSAGCQDVRKCACAGAAGEPGPAQSINGGSVRSWGPRPPHTRLYCRLSIANEHRPSWTLCSVLEASRASWAFCLGFEKLSLNSSAPTLHLPHTLTYTSAFIVHHIRIQYCCWIPVSNRI